MYYYHLGSLGATDVSPGPKTVSKFVTYPMVKMGNQSNVGLCNIAGSWGHDPPPPYLTQLLGLR